jgi:DNA helicase-2/ATP-dependent DNA helicase PcrA
VFDPFGDAARRRDDDFDDLNQDVPASRPSAGGRSARGDGLTIDVDDAQDETARPEPAARRRRGFEGAIQRAADLAARMESEGRPRRTFAVGQRVRHADYGEGAIAGISGTGPRSVGTVIFDGPAGTRKFILGHGALAPIDD